ncbi:SRPBCC family protein [Yaniella flava]
MSEQMYSSHEVTEVDTGPYTISYRTLVAAEPEQLWKLASNPHRHHELDGGGTLSTKVTGPEELAQGDTFNIWMRQFGLPYTLTMRVVTAHTKREIAWQHPGKHIWRWTFEPADDGGTWVTETFDYTQVTPLMIRGFNWMGILKNNAKNMQASLTQLQQRFT